MHKYKSIDIGYENLISYWFVLIGKTFNISIRLGNGRQS